MPTQSTSSDTTFTLSFAALQQQSLEALKETQDYAVRVAELAADHPFVRTARGIPSPAELIDGSFGVAMQALELQREFLGKLVGAATPAAD
jgi:hypothetical protein